MDFEDLPIGIDLGTTNSCIGVFRNGSVEIIPNQNQGKLIPSVVSFCGEKIAIGEQTLDQVYNDPEKVIYSIKRIIGRNSAEKEYNELIENLTYKNKITTDDKGRPFINVDFNGKNRKYTPQEISAMILRKLKENAKIYLGKEIKKVVITIPAYFTDAQREATKEAGILAGLEVIKIINEPTAAVLAYGLKDKNDLLNSDDDNNFCLFSHKEKQNKESNEKNEKTILVFDLGGGTFDVTCLKLINDDEAPEFEIKGHSGYTLLGGDDFDNILVDYCIQKFEKEYNKTKGKKKHIEINKESKEGLYAIKRLKIYCEKIKRRLSEHDKATICINKLYEGKNFKLEIKREEFHNLCKRKFEEIMPPINDALKTAKIKKEDIDEILLVGGSTRIPKIKEILKSKSYFGKKIIINDTINPDEVVAYGATLQAAISMKKPAMEDILINEICPHSIGIEVVDKKYKENICDILIEKGTNIPFEKEHQYTTIKDYQKCVSINIYEGEHLFCKDNRLLGQFKLNNISIAKKGIPQIMEKIKIDEDSIIHVTAYEKLSGAYNSLDIKYDKRTLSKNEINAMKNRLQKDEEFEKTNINSKEKELSVEKKLLYNEYKDNKNVYNLIKLVEIQEKLVDIISIDNENINNYEKKFENVSYLFKYYNFLFTNYFEEYKEKNDYLKKIKKYMEIFKDGDPFYLKSLVLIFKDDKYKERLEEIVYYCIFLINDNIKTQSINKEFISYYYDEILELMDIFKKLMEKSKFKEKFNSLRNELIFEREKLKFKFWPKDLTLDEAISAIDQVAYIIENFSYSISRKSSSYEKSFRSYFITKLICLELTYFKNNDLNYLIYLKKLAEEALKLIKECKMEDAWIENLWDSHKSISQKIEEKEKEALNSLKNSITSMSQKKMNEIDGSNDDKNIEYFEFLFKEVFKNNNNNKNIKDLYTNDKKQLKKITMRCINKLPDTKKEEKEFKSLVHTNFNKIEKYWENNNLI